MGSDSAVHKVGTARRHPQAVLEATDDVTTRNRDVRDDVDRSGRRQRTVRVFRDIHGNESTERANAFVIVNDDHGGRHASGHDDVLDGDTGSWYVPTAEVLAHGGPSAGTGAARTTFRALPTSVTSRARSRSVSVTARRSSDSFLFDTRIDRDLRPLFTSNSAVGGINASYPFDHSTWSGDSVGDTYLGAKVNLLSQSRQNPVAFAVRGIVKVPTGDKNTGASTGKTDVIADLILSGEVARAIELSAYGGYAFLGKPDGIDTPSGAVRWGGGALFPSRSPLRGVFELNGAIPSQSTATITTASILLATMGSLPPTVSSVEDLTRATAGLTWQSHGGFFAGAGVS